MIIPIKKKYKYIQQQHWQPNYTNDSPYSYKISNQKGERPPVYDYNILIIATKMTSNHQTSPIGRIVFAPDVG